MRADQTGRPKQTGKRRRMKPRAPLSVAAALLSPFCTGTLAFAPPRRAAPAVRPLRATLTRDELGAMSRAEQFGALGVEEDKLAMGIDPDEVLEYIGTRDDLVAKFRSDIPSFSPSEVETEVDKFLMDGEMVDLMIKYIDRKREDPGWEPPAKPEEDDSLLGRAGSFVGQYGIYVVGILVLRDVVTTFLKNKEG